MAPTPGQVMSVVDSLGSGVLISKDGKILTAAHVVQTADVAWVEFPDGQVIRAHVIGSDVRADIALLKLEHPPANVAPVAVGDSDKVEVGDQIFVIGAPYGIGETLSAGHVSGRHRLNKQAQREFVVNPFNGSARESTLLLSNGGRATYKEMQVEARYKFRERDELVASYTRSKSEGNLNDYNSYFGNFQNPIVRPDERGPLPWDAPHRFLLWGSFGVKYGITVAPVLDIRSGFPLSNIDEDRDFVGGRNRAGRFPTFGSLDLQVLKSVSAPGRWKETYRLRLGAKVFNLTNHFNPRDYQGNLASGEFGGFYNGVERKFGLKFVVERK